MVGVESRRRCRHGVSILVGSYITTAAVKPSPSEDLEVVRVHLGDQFASRWPALPARPLGEPVSLDNGALYAGGRVPLPAMTDDSLNFVVALGDSLASS
ncbi:hypothetical protein ABZT51_33645 [Streptomyces sp. NPDC005373]|uniref:hypothetical protein n=1 Tax=Streptomyces sp. NPDC005373 TaxID=3156879 RepID=UPI0033BADF51